MKSLTIAVFALAIVSAVNVWQTMELKRAIPASISRAQDRAEAMDDYRDFKEIVRTSNSYGKPEFEKTLEDLQKRWKASKDVQIQAQ